MTREFPCHPVCCVVFHILLDFFFYFRYVDSGIVLYFDFFVHSDKEDDSHEHRRGPSLTHSSVKEGLQ